jgi:hypothetical protein
MPTSLVALLVLLRSLIRSRADLQLENLVGPLPVGFSVAYMARLAFHVSHRQAGNRCGLASHGLSLVLDLEASTGTTGTPRDCPRDSRPDPLGGAPRVHGELLKPGIHIGESGVTKYMVRCRKPPSQTWRTFLDNHVYQLVSVDFFRVPTIRFQVAASGILRRFEKCSLPVS